MTVANALAECLDFGLAAVDMGRARVTQNARVQRRSRGDPAQPGAGEGAEAGAEVVGEPRGAFAAGKERGEEEKGRGIGE